MSSSCVSGEVGEDVQLGEVGEEFSAFFSTHNERLHIAKCE